MKDQRSPLAKVKGLGTSSEASHFFWVQRLTALALIPITLWLCLSIALLPEATYPAVLGWFHTPFNAVMLILFMIIAFHHAQSGMQVIFEDYIASYSKRLTAILLVKFVSYLFMALSVYSILKLSLGVH